MRAQMAAALPRVVRDWEVLQRFSCRTCGSVAGELCDSADPTRVSKGEQEVCLAAHVHALPHLMQIERLASRDVVASSPLTDGAVIVMVFFQRPDACSTGKSSNSKVPIGVNSEVRVCLSC